VSPAPTVGIATGNAGKVREIAAILADLPLALRAVAGDVAFPEEGDAYEPNAVAKARTLAEAWGVPALADDSGLEVDALDGGPGPRSARFGGPGLDDAGRVAHLLETLREVPRARRAARFVCVAALAWPDGRVVARRGECVGRILTAPRGVGGFGYDPVFWVPERGAAMSELPAAEKNRISHRARAFLALRPELEALRAAEPAAAAGEGGPAGR
jgi:XTP/dITP diphosphohydrolase